jgi:hypothetical protein
VEAPVRFRFRCGGRRFSAEVVARARGHVVRVTADAGYVPYTAESLPLRRMLLKALAAGVGTAAGAGIELAPDQRILLTAEMSIDPPIRPEHVVATATALAITSGDALSQIARLCSHAPEAPEPA